MDATQQQCCGGGAASEQHTDCASAGTTLIEADFECTVCADVLNEPVTAPCGHDMCKGCYRKWCQASCGVAVCPLCRAPMPPTLGVSLRLKRVVEELYPAATKRRRLEQEACSEGDNSSCKTGCSVACGSAPAQGNAWALPSMQLQQQQFMSAMYSTYQQWNIHAAYARAAEAAIGTPVMDIVQQQHRWHLQTMAATSQPITTSSSWASAATGPHPGSDSAPPTSDPAVSSSDPRLHPALGLPVQGRWQTVADVPMRLACAREILALICARSAAATAGGAHPTPATLAAVRALEVHLYRIAGSRAEYLERSTLPSRVAAYVRRRASVLAASAAQLAGGEVEQLPAAAARQVAKA